VVWQEWRRKRNLASYIAWANMWAWWWWPGVRLGFAV